MTRVFASWGCGCCAAKGLCSTPPRPLRRAMATLMRTRSMRTEFDNVCPQCLPVKASASGS
eukprot:3765453-Alexandrium_andersonii.AAC.1